MVFLQISIYAMNPENDTMVFFNKLSHFLKGGVPNNTIKFNGIFSGVILS